MIESFKCDALVLGGGPAGTCIAVTLSRAGFNVLQVLNNVQDVERPYEVLAPYTRHLLRKAGLSEPGIKTSNCRGVLSLWENSEPNLHDYKFNTCVSGLTINRSAFHESLHADSIAAGVRIIQGSFKIAGNVNKDNNNITLLVDGRSVNIKTELIFAATGRNKLLKNIIPDRQYLSKLVALSTPIRTKKWSDYLLVEAATHGWWYVPPSIDGQSQLVFLTDADLLPKNKIDKRKWLAENFKQSTIIQTIADCAPAFHDMRGTDARFSRLKTPVIGRWIFAGDAALSLDPLSGTGTCTALAGAMEAANIPLNDRNGLHYTEWCRSSFEKEIETYATIYSQAARRLQQSQFWKRRQILY